MEHASELTIPAHRIWAELTSEDFLRAFAAEVGVAVDELDIRDDAATADASMLWSFDTARPGIPDLAAKFLPENVRLRWKQSWQPLESGSATGQLEVVLQGRPSATSLGDCVLVGGGLASTLTTSTTTRADLPFPVRKAAETLIDKELVGWILSVQARVLVRRNPS